MANPHRGEVDLAIGGRTLGLRLTLGSLAELEDALGAEGLAALGRRLQSGRLSARDICAILAAGCRGAGETLTAEEVAEAVPASALAAAAEAAVRLLAAAFGGGDAARPPQPQAAA